MSFQTETKDTYNMKIKLMRVIIGIKMEAFQNNSENIWKLRRQVIKENNHKHKTCLGKQQYVYQKF